MVAAVREPKILKRFYSDTFAPPTGFRADVRGPEVTAEEILARGVDESDWSFPILVSTPSEDRQGDVVIPEGGDYSAFAHSPIFFFDHQEIKFPVGSLRGPDGRLYLCVVPGRGILGRVWIRKPAPDDPPAYAEACKTVWILVRDGLLNGISAGFDPVPGYTKALRGGGNKYERWELLEISGVPIAANRECRVIREPFSWDDAILKRFSPSVIKGLKTMSAATAVAKGEHNNTRDIKFENGKWHLLDNKTRKTLSTHDSREDALAALRAIEFHKHGGKSTEPEQQKDMSESSGTGGGYTVPEEEKSIRAEIVKRMDDNECKGHYAYFHPASGEMRHVHPVDLAPEKVKSIAGDLHDIPGVKSMTQTAEHPAAAEGFHKVYPQATAPLGLVHHVRKHKQMSAIGKALYRMIRKRKLNGWIRTALEKRVCKSIMPRLLQCEMPEKRAIPIAWGIAGVQKGLLPLIQKAMNDDDDDDDDDTADDAENAVDDAATDAAMDMSEEDMQQPRSLELIQAAIENLEAALPGLEPEDRTFVEEQIEAWRKWGEEKHPGEDFGGADDAGAEAAAAGANDDAKEEKESDEMLARYKSYRPVRVKHISVAKVKKSLQKDPMAADTIRKAANHLHDIGNLHGEFDEKKGHCILKGYTAGLHRASRKIARDLDRVYGAITKGEEKPAAKEEEKPQDQPAVDSDEDFGPVVKSMREEFSNMKTALAKAAGVRLRA